MSNPLILTLAIDEHWQQYFNMLRKQHFPPERNFLDAHLTLFHQLPAHDAHITGTLSALAQSIPQFNMNVDSPVSIGNGVAFKIASKELSKMHGILQKEWQQWLIPQDRQRLYPHITIQNKVDQAAAKTLLTELSAAFEPFKVTATGVLLWEYLGGPWRFVESYPFRKL